MRTYEWYEARGRCECGVKLDEHPPLPKPGPLRSWHARRTTDEIMSERARNGLTDAQVFRLTGQHRRAA